MSDQLPVELPRSWSLAPLKSIATLTPGGTPDSDNADYWANSNGEPWVAIGDMSGTDLVSITDRTITTAGRASVRLRGGPRGTVLFAMYASVGAVSMLGMTATWNQAILGLTAKSERATPRFVFYALKSARNQLPYLYRSNTQNNLNAEQVGALRLPVPPLDEQRQIVEYLDRETGQIDALIAKQEQLVETLTERRQAVIAQAVTRGLDLAVDLKKSGTPWFDQIPSHWRVSRLKHLGRTQIGLTYDPADIVDDTAGTLVLRSGNVQRGNIDLADTVFVCAPIPPRLVTSEGDILICSRNGSRVLIGKNARITAEIAGSTFGAFMTVLRSPLSDYLYWVLNSLIFHQQMGSFVTATINQLTNGTLNNFDIPVPPTRDEQLRITGHLEDATSKIDALIAKAREMTAVLRERRQALISAAVTGKIDVRGL